MTEEVTEIGGGREETRGKEKEREKEGDKRAGQYTSCSRMAYYIK